MLLYRLRHAKEFFKVTREDRLACFRAKQLLGIEPLLEHYVNKKHPAMWWDEDGERHVAAEPPAKSTVKILLPTPGGLRPNTQARFEDFIITEDLYDLMYNMDGATVEERRSKNGQAHWVWVEQGEWVEPMQHPDENPDATKLSKIHFMVITGPCGVLAVAPMFTGSRLKSSGCSVRFWWRRLVELGIGTRQRERELEAKHSKWKVCSALQSLHYAPDGCF